jgi:O-succinylbenzoic acid--CoA ligase
MMLRKFQFYKFFLIHLNSLAIQSDETSLTYLQLWKEIKKVEKKLLNHIPSNFNKIAMIAHSNIDVIVIYLSAVINNLGVFLISPKEPLEKIEEKKRDFGEFYFIFDDQIEQIKKNKSIKKVKRDPCQAASFLETSGTSGQSKIVALSYKNHLESAKNLVSNLSLSNKSRYLLNLPLNHVSGLSILYRVIYSGSSLILKKQQKDFSSFLQENKITHLSLVSTQLKRWIEEALFFSPASLKAILVGGSALSNALLKEALEKNLPIFKSYGMTESASALTCIRLNPNLDLNSSGIPFKNSVIKIIENGEIVVNGPSLFLGYYDAKEKKILIRNENFHTKDLGCFSLNCQLFISGRKDRMKILGGENVYPEEIEDVIEAIQGVKRCYITFKKDPDYDFKMIAIIKKRPTLLFQEIKSILEKKLPNYKRPKIYLNWPTHLQEENSAKLSYQIKSQLELYAFSKSSLSELEIDLDLADEASTHT